MWTSLSTPSYTPNAESSFDEMIAVAKQLTFATLCNICEKWYCLRQGASRAKYFKRVFSAKQIFMYSNVHKYDGPSIKAIPSRPRRVEVVVDQAKRNPDLQQEPLPKYALPTAWNGNIGNVTFKYQKCLIFSKSWQWTEPYDSDSWFAHLLN